MFVKKIKFYIYYVKKDILYLFFVSFKYLVCKYCAYLCTSTSYTSIGFAYVNLFGEINKK